MVILRKLTEADKLELAEIANNKKIWDNVRDYFPYPYSLKDAENFIQTVSNEDPQVTFAISYDNRLARVTGFILRTDIHRKPAEIGYCLGEQYWNKGIATKAVNLLVAYGFEELGLIRIDTGVFEFNAASCKVLEKCGFVKEAVLKNAVIKNGMIGNEVRYCKLKI